MESLTQYKGLNGVVNTNFDETIHQNFPSILPKDFVVFINSNYERIHEIHSKILDFYTKSRNTTQRHLCKNLSTLSYSDPDELSVITAKVVPKFSQRSDTIQVEDTYLTTHERDPIVENKEDLESILQRFPLVSLTLEGSSNTSEEDDSLFIQGYSKEFSARNPISPKVILSSSKHSSCNNSENRIKIQSQKSKSVSTTTPKKNLESFPPSVHEIAWELYNKYALSKSKTNTPSNSKQLTLPPLHSSVLTLLGQKAPGSFSTIPGHGGSIPSKQKKLRRHGRRRASKTSETREQQSETRESENKNSAEREIPPDDQLKPEEILNNSAIPLQEILDESMSRKYSWYTTREKLDAEIESLRQSIAATNTTKLRANSIGIKEDIWLGLERWSVSSATFYCPRSSIELERMRPLDYLTKYVEISQPRQDLYNLVFKRYLTMENPLGKTITIQTAQRALSEILGRSLKATEKSELFHKHLHINSEDLELSELDFKGICAFCERLYGDYSLGESKDCYVCSNYPKTDKNKCHRKRPNATELADLELIKRKIQNNQVNPELVNLFNALIDNFVH